MFVEVTTPGNNLWLHLLYQPIRSAEQRVLLRNGR
jgi:hypothetical protein